MNAKERAYLIVVQILAVLALVIGVCMEVQAIINVLKWNEVAGKNGIAGALLGIVSLVIGGGVLVCYGWFVGMMSLYWKKEQR